MSKNNNKKNYSNQSTEKEVVVNEEVTIVEDSVEEAEVLDINEEPVQETETIVEDVPVETIQEDKVEESVETEVLDVKEEPVQESETIVEEVSIKTLNVEEVKESIPTPIVETSVKPVIMDKGFYISLGFIQAGRKNEVDSRLKKACINYNVNEDGEYIVGPYKNQEDCVRERKIIVRNGLKCRIIEK